MPDESDPFEAVLIRRGFTLRESESRLVEVRIESIEFDFIPEETASFKKVIRPPKGAPVFLSMQIRVREELMSALTIAHVKDNRWWKKDAFVDLTDDGFFRLMQRISVN